jgi:RND family efflux transporter MFP subunit
MNKRYKWLIPAGVFGGLLALAMLIYTNPPASPQRRPAAGPNLVVETMPVRLQSYRVELQSYGTVQPRTQTTLISQVRGQIVYVNPNVRDGGYFKKGEVLASIDARDYEADVRIAEAILMDSRQQLAEAEARTMQAREDWERLGNSDEVPGLVLKLPQLEAAKARVVSAESTLQKARLELERTDIVAPYAGRILRKQVGIGQVVNTNQALADIYATDYVEVRLPLRNSDLGYIELPESYVDDAAKGEVAQVRILSSLVGETEWAAKLVRTEGAIDENARQLHVIAQVDDPFSQQSDNRSPLKIGEYVTAKLTGKTLSSVLVIPNNTIYQGSYVYVIEGDVLQRRDIEIAWQNERDAIIEAGLADGESLVTTPLGQVTSGVRVRVSGS